jgi:hypothetical protein
MTEEALVEREAVLRLLRLEADLSEGCGLLMSPERVRALVGIVERGEHREKDT